MVKKNGKQGCFPNPHAGCVRYATANKSATVI